MRASGSGWLLIGAVAILASQVLLAGTSLAGPVRELRVCADPNNLPFSNNRLEGFENRIVQLLAADLGAEVRYTWWAQRRGFLRNTLRAGSCDVVPGAPSNVAMLATTKPYYRSAYVFVSREDDHLELTSLDDPRLRSLRIGVQMVGSGANSPPAHALARRGIIDNVVGYMVYGDYRDADPPARIIGAVAQREIDVAIAWGPVAGYFARRQSVPLALAPVAPRIDGPTLPMLFDISIGVRREDVELRDTLDEALARNRVAIDTILADYNVPRLDRPGLREANTRQQSGP